MTYRFGIFEFDAAAGDLRKEGRSVALEPQPAKALALLLSKAGEVVAREELKAAVWGSGTHVDFDRGLAYCVSQIRTALNDTAENPRFIQTIPRHGFRFIAPVVPGAKGGEGATRAKGWMLVGAALAVVLLVVVARLSVREQHDVVRIAVSVFDNETGQSEYDGIVAGLSDVVVERLTKIAPDRIAVIGNAAVLRQPRNIRNLQAMARQVEADYVLLGQLQRGETGLRFITHFIRLRDEAHLKANRLPIGDDRLTGLEAAVTQEFERAVREHVLTGAGN